MLTEQCMGHTVCGFQAPSNERVFMAEGHDCRMFTVLAPCIASCCVCSDDDGVCL
jgi:hypothetical protein